VYLTTDELAAVVNGVDALIKPYVDARPLDDAATRPEGSMPVDLTYLVSVASPSAGHFESVEE
jgi:hypothetical protein